MATWAKKPGQTTQQAQADANNSSVYRQSVGFATGQAQPQQSPYATATPYQKNKGGDFAAYSPQQQFGNTTLSQSYSPGQSPFTARYGQPDGSFSSTPNYNQRDAFVQALNNQYTPYMTGQATGAPQFDIGAAWNQASQMVQQGWQNPFAPNMAAQMEPMYQSPLPNLAAQAFPSQYQPANLPMAPPTAQPATPVAAETSQQDRKRVAAQDRARAEHQKEMYRIDTLQRRGDYTPQQADDLRRSAGRALLQDSERAASRMRSEPPAPPPAQFAPVPNLPPRTPSSLLAATPGSPQAPAPVSWEMGYGADNNRRLEAARGAARNPVQLPAINAADPNSYQQSTFDQEYELNRGPLERQGIGREQYYDQRKLEAGSLDALNNNPLFQQHWSDIQRSQMTPTMWATQQNAPVAGGVIGRPTSASQEAMNSQAQWLADRGQTGVPDGSARPTLSGAFRDFAAQQGIDYAAQFDSGNQARFDAYQRANSAFGGVNDTVAAQLADRQRRSRSQEDVIRQFRQERGVDPRSQLQTKKRPSVSV